MLCILVIWLPFLYQPVYKYEQAQPDDVHEVPVPGDAFKAEVIL
ncbi:hypothetical protein C8R21_1121, partial [Nitrosospira multiformis]